MGGSSEDFSVVVLASDLGVDARPFLEHDQQQQEEENWHDCSQYLSPDEDFSDLDQLQFLRLQGSDKNSNRILRIVGKYFPGTPSTPSSTQPILVISCVLDFASHTHFWMLFRVVFAILLQKHQVSILQLC